MPESGTVAFVCNSHGHAFVSMLDMSDEWRNGNTVIYNVTHWQPIVLPEQTQ